MPGQLAVEEDPQPAPAWLLSDLRGRPLGPLDPMGGAAAALCPSHPIPPPPAPVSALAPSPAAGTAVPAPFPSSHRALWRRTEPSPWSGALALERAVPCSPRGRPVAHQLSFLWLRLRFSACCWGFRGLIRTCPSLLSLHFVLLGLRLAVGQWFLVFTALGGFGPRRFSSPLAHFCHLPQLLFALLGFRCQAASEGPGRSSRRLICWPPGSLLPFSSWKLHPAFPCPPLLPPFSVPCLLNRWRVFPGHCPVSRLPCSSLVGPRPPLLRLPLAICWRPAAGTRLSHRL